MSDSTVIRHASERYRKLVANTTHAVLESPGETDPKVRWAVFHGRTDEIPANLRSYVDTVRRRAVDTSDADVEALKRAGYSEDAIFEITATAALGAAIMRLERGLIVLHASAERSPTVGQP